MSSNDYCEQVIRKAAIYRPQHLRHQAVLALHAFALQHECLITEIWSYLEDLRQCPAIAHSDDEFADLTQQLMQIYSDFMRLDQLIQGVLNIDADFPRVGGEAFQATADEMRSRQARTQNDHLESTRRSLEQLITKPSDSNENT